MIQDQYIPEDGETSRSLVQEQNRLMHRNMVLLRYNGVTGGNTPDGVSPSRSNIMIEMPAQLRFLTGKDILVMGTQYAIGDMYLESELDVLAADNKRKTQADMILFDSKLYILVGMPFPIPYAGGTNRCASVWRRSA